MKHQTDHVSPVLYFVHYFFMAILAFFFKLLLLICIARLYCVFRRFFSQSEATTIGFFHPWAGACGGGERVLWQMIKTLIEKFQLEDRELRILLYCGQTFDSEGNECSLLKVVEKVETRFGLKICVDRVTKVPLATRTLLEAKWYPICTLLGQAVGSVLVGLEALLKHP